jgi:hypothetical protein
VRPARRRGRRPRGPASGRSRLASARVRAVRSRSRSGARGCAATTGSAGRSTSPARPAPARRCRRQARSRPPATSPRRWSAPSRLPPDTMIDPAARKATPEVTASIRRNGSETSPWKRAMISKDRSAKRHEASETRICVRNPAVRACSARSSPITPPSTIATTSRPAPPPAWSPKRTGRSGFPASAGSRPG